MDEHPEPTIGQWYRNQENKRIFEVVALDEDEGTIEVQYFESEIEEIDLDTWYEIPLENIPEPEDWSGPYDDLVADDFGDTDVTRHGDQWNNPIDELE
jgi:hypothetical protein